MVKSREDVIAQFNELVNMSAEELQAWLDEPKNEKSEKAGTGVGIESGHKIIEILKKNPDKDPEKYDEEDIDHMRKVVGYNSWHIAQEDHFKETKTREELANTKSTISLKNWGHDPLKSLSEDGKGNTGDDSKDPSSRETSAALEERGGLSESTSKRKLDESSKHIGEETNNAEESEGSERGSGTVVSKEEGAERPRKKSRSKRGDVEDMLEAELGPGQINEEE